MGGKILTLVCIYNTEKYKDVVDSSDIKKYILKLDNKYVFQLQTDVRAWSLELTGGANVWIANDNYGGTCHIPDVVEVDCDEVLNSL